METKNLVKIIIDILMTILFVILLDAFGTGLVFHEIMGLSIFLLFGFHILLNWAWVKNVTKNLLSSRMKTPIKIKYLLNLSLFLSILIIIISGIMISQVLLPSSFANNETLIIIHKWTSYFCLVLFGIHTALHTQYLKTSIQKMFSHFKDRNVKNILIRFGAGAIIIVSIYARIIFGVTEAISNDFQAQLDQENSAIVNTELRREENDNANSDTSVYSSDSDYSDNGNAPISLAEFLGKLYCTGCPKHCSLLSPQCGKADPQIKAATIEYQELYSGIDKS